MAHSPNLPANPRISVAELEGLHRDAYSWALSRCRQVGADAADLLQNAYARLLDGSAKFEGRSSLRTFLFGIIDRLAREQRRRARLHTLLLGRFGAILEPSAPPAVSDATSDADSMRISAALFALSPRQRDVLELVFYRDCSIEEAARIMGTTLGTARTHYERGKQSMAAALKLT